MTHYLIDGIGVDYHTIRDELYKLSKNSRDKIRTRKQKYLNIPCAFDIETTSTYIAGSKVAYMYIWTYAIGEHIIIQGRTWDEWIKVNKLIAGCMVSPEWHLCVYVHNLAFEFQFFRGYIPVRNVLSTGTRQVISVESDIGIDYRCSYRLTGKSLSSLAHDVKSMSINKLQGDLDYRLIRTAKTRLTHREYAYTHNDVLIIVGYIRDCIKRDGHINNIPLTATGYVRRYFRDKCIYTRNTGYRNIIRRCKLTTDDYIMLREEFGGGFTHASCLNVMHVHNNVESWDETSAYPTMCLAYQYPMSQFYKESNPNRYKYHMQCHACLFRASVYNITPKIIAEHPISASHCRNIVNAVVDNGRIVSADALEITVNEVDWQVMLQYYNFDYEITDLRFAYKRYLPRQFVETLIELYETKTQLKGVADRAEDYMLAKNQFNAAYGMMVENIVKDSLIYKDGKWVKPDINIDDAIDDYNTSPKRFLYYAWGCWVTAYARRALLHVIAQLGDAHIYGDTDSTKCTKSNDKIFVKYNNYIKKQLRKICDYYDIDYNRLSPSTIKGDRKQIGIFERECTYKQFKTLGAKRYMYTDQADKVHTVISGVNNSTGGPWLQSVADKRNISPYALFDDDLIIPYEGCLRLTHTYIDHPLSGSITDYRGKSCKYDALASVHLEESNYTLNMLDSYIQYIHDIQGGYTLY